MSVERVGRSVYLETRLSHDEIRQVLVKYGEIRGIYPNGITSAAAQSRYFVEFLNASIANRTLASPPTSMDVYALASSPSLVEQFRSVASPDLCDEPRHDKQYSPSHNDKVAHAHDLRTKYRPKTTHTALGRTSPSPTMSASRQMRLNASRQPLTVSCTRTSQDRGDDKENRGHSRQSWPWGGRDQPTMDPATQPYHYPLFTPVAQRSEPPTQCLGSSLYPSVDFRPLASDTSTYSHGDGAFPVNLDSLDVSPGEVIASLKDAASLPLGCAKWMMAGAHYRARGNVPAAVAVITSMIQVMTDVGMDRSQLKPALLLLASCHFDIAKQLRQQSTKTMESKFHFDIACEYLRDVYGTFVPPASTVQHYQHPACSSTVVHTTASPKADGPDSPQAQRTSNRMFSPEPTLQYSQVRTLGLEIQSHRDGGETMGHTRSTKRRLEEGLETEKRVRRKLEYGPKATEYSVCGVNEASEPVPDQRRVETATPLCAEDHVEETRQGVADPQTSLEPRVAEHVVWDKKFKDFFSKLGVVFLRAARGDLGEVLSG